MFSAVAKPEDFKWLRETIFEFRALISWRRLVCAGVGRETEMVVSVVCDDEEDVAGLKVGDALAVSDDNIVCGASLGKEGAEEEAVADADSGTLVEAGDFDFVFTI